MNPADIAVPIRSQFADTENVEVHLSKVEFIDVISNCLKLKDSELEIEFDYLILACGAKHSYFARPDWESFAPG